MPKKDGQGPPKTATGPKDGRGNGKGLHSSGAGTGEKTGGKKGDCK